MTFKTLTAALILMALPGMSLAMGCSGAKHQQAQSCAQGSTWDSASQSCKPIVNS